MKQRLLQYITHLNISQLEFENRANIIIGKRNEIHYKKVRRISGAFLDLNIEWLIYGRGGMIVVEKKNAN